MDFPQPFQLMNVWFLKDGQRCFTVTGLARLSNGDLGKGIMLSDEMELPLRDGAVLTLCPRCESGG